jgi:UDP-glucose 4-epimerase
LRYQPYPFMRRDDSTKRWTVAVTGAGGDLGRLLLPLLQDDTRIERIIAIDHSPPEHESSKVEFRRVELSQPHAEDAVANALTQTKADALVHLSFLTGHVHSASFAHELEVIGSMQVLRACTRAKLPRLIVPSLTALYGARPQHPAYLKEDAPLLGCAGSRFINDKVEVERQIDEFSRSNPETQVVVLRFAPIVGRKVDNPLTRLLKNRVVPTLMGFDPLWQVIHEDDAASALMHALFTSRSGTYNVAANGLLSLSGMVRQSGGAALPLPAPLARAAIKALEALGIASVPEAMFDYLRFSWVADSRRAEQELGFAPRFPSKLAVATLKGN